MGEGPDPEMVDDANSAKELRAALVDLLTKCTCEFNDCVYHDYARALVGLDRDAIQRVRDGMETVGPDGVTRLSHPAVELPERAFYMDDNNGRIYRR